MAAFQIQILQNLRKENKKSGGRKRRESSPKAEEQAKHEKRGKTAGKRAQFPTTSPRYERIIKTKAWKSQAKTRHFRQFFFN
jgi:hypothetical protein